MPELITATTTEGAPCVNCQASGTCTRRSGHWAFQKVSLGCTPCALERRAGLASWSGEGAGRVGQIVRLGIGHGRIGLQGSDRGQFLALGHEPRHPRPARRCCAAPASPARPAPRLGHAGRRSSASPPAPDPGRTRPAAQAAARAAAAGRAAPPRRWPAAPPSRPGSSPRTRRPDPGCAGGRKGTRLQSYCVTSCGAKDCQS